MDLHFTADEPTAGQQIQSLIQLLHKHGVQKRVPTRSQRDDEESAPEMSGARAIEVLQLCFAVYQASDSRAPVDPRTISGSVTPAGWAEW